MDKTTIKNMPYGQLYEFADGKFVWKIFRVGGTRGGNYLTNLSTISEYIEVFALQGDGSLACTWSGRLSSNPHLQNEDGLDKDGCFYIFSYDQDCAARFEQKQDLKLAAPEIQIQALDQEKNVISYISDRIREEQSNKRS